MATFDAEVFARTLFSEAQWIIDGAASEASIPDRYQLDEVRTEVRELTQDVEATLAALEIEKDPRRAKLLRDDIATFLPARHGSIMTLAAGVPPLSLQSLGLSLEFASRCVTVVSRSFIAKSGL